MCDPLDNRRMVERVLPRTIDSLVGRGAWLFFHGNFAQY